MSLPLYPTLLELRNQVLLRCGYSNDGNQAAGIAPMVDALIAGAERELFPEMQWLKSVTRATITMTTGNSSVDWPDDAEPGEIQSVWVHRADNGALSEVFPGVHLNERDTSENGEDGKPLLYEELDETIYLNPTPSADYDYLYIQYLKAPKLVQESDRCLVDPELLIQRSTMKLKEFLGLPIGQVDMANHERYMTRLRASNSSKSGYVVGGHKSWRTSVQKANRISANTRIGSSASYSNEWSPW